MPRGLRTGRVRCPRCTRCDNDATEIAHDQTVSVVAAGDRVPGRGGELVPGTHGERGRCLSRIARPGDSSLELPRSGIGKQTRCTSAGRSRPLRPQKPAARSAIRCQGYLRHRRNTDRVGLADPARPPAGPHLRPGLQARVPGRHTDRQDPHDGVCLLRHGTDQEPARSGPDPGGIIERFGGCRRFRHGPSCNRQPDSGLGAAAGVILRDRGVQTELRCPAPGGRHAVRALAGSRRHFRPDRGRHPGRVAGSRVRDGRRSGDSGDGAGLAAPRQA